MKKIFKGTGLAVILILLALTCSEAKTAYVSDLLILTFREGPGTNFAVLKTLRSNTPLNVLEEDQGYYKVQLETGEEGWVDKQFVMFEPPSALLVEQLQKEKAELENRLAQMTQSSDQLKEQQDADSSKASEKLTALENQLRQLEQDNTRLARELEKSRQEMTDFKAASADVVTAIETNKNLAAEHQRLTEELSRMENESSREFRTGMIKWFLAGVGVLLMGWLIGMMLSSNRRRRSSLLD